MPDLDVSYALGSTLITHGRDGQFASSLASSWQIDSEKHQIAFVIPESAKWSDKSPLTAAQVVDSFADTKLHFEKSIPSLFESYSKLESLGNKVIFTLKPGITPQRFLEKLTEPMHGIVKIIGGRASDKVTSGAYFVESVNPSELVLSANLYWFNRSANTVDRVVLRKPKEIISVRTLLDDQWPDLVNFPNLILEKDVDQLPHDFSTWRRANDRLLALSHAGKNLPAIRALFNFLRAKAPLEKVTQLIAGGHLAKQIYSKGLILHSENDPQLNHLNDEQLKSLWPTGRVSLAYDPSRIPSPVIETFKADICSTLPLKCEFHSIQGQSLADIRRKGLYDVILGSVGVDSINLDGALSYYFELNPSMIPSDQSEKGNFIERLKKARQSGNTDLVPVYRQILFDAVEGGYVLPLAHYSTTFIGRPRIDFSKVPPVFETVPFSMIKIRQ
jgi:hypothetical protein